MPRAGRVRGTEGRGGCPKEGAIVSETLLEQIVGTFKAREVNITDLPVDDPVAQIGNVCERLFTDGVDVLRSLIPNERVRALSRVVWDLIGNKRALVALGPDVPTLSFTAMRLQDTVKGIVLIPKQWPQMVEEDTSFMQLGAILFVGVQVVDFHNDRLIGDPGAKARSRAYEAELLHTLARTLPSWKPNDYQRQILDSYPEGLDSKGIYPYQPFRAPQEAS